MSEGPLVAHSLAEVYLYLMVTPCAACGAGPLKGRDARPTQAESAVAVADVLVDVTCAACGNQSAFRFEVPAEDLVAAKAARPDSAARVSAADEPSRIIDVGGWLTLFSVIAEAAAKAVDKVEARKLGYEAAQCLEEALKFYDDENDLPPDEAFFSEDSRRRYREHPQRLARSRLIDLRAKLPSIDAMEKRLASAGAKKKPWWRLWR